MSSTNQSQGLVAPLGNTGQNRQIESQPDFTVGIDWLRVIMPVKKRKHVDGLVRWLMSWFTDEFTWFDAPVREGKRWENYGRSVCGITAYYNLTDDEKGIKGELMVSIPASVIARIHQQKFLWVCERLYFQHSARATRFDLALDDFRGLLTKEDVQEAVKLHNVARFQRTSFVESRKNGSSNGWTAYFGSRQSDVMVRIYDKATESKGRINSVRLEIEYKNELAHHLFEKCATLFAKFHSLRDGHKYVATGLVSYFFDKSFGISFIDRRLVEWDDLQRPNRCDECIWWERFKFFVQRTFPNGQYEVELARPKPVRTLQKSFDWLDYKTAKTFVKSCLVRGEQWTISQLKLLGETLSLHDWKQVEIALREMQTILKPETLTTQ